MEFWIISKTDGAFDRRPGVLAKLTENACLEEDVRSTTMLNQTSAVFVEGRSSKAQKRKDHCDHHHQADDIDNAVHKDYLLIECV